MVQVATYEIVVQSHAEDAGSVDGQLEVLVVQVGF